MVTTLEAFQMLCRDLYLPFTAVLTVAGLSQRKDRSNVHMHTFSDRPGYGVLKIYLGSYFQLQGTNKLFDHSR